MNRWGGELRSADPEIGTVVEGWMGKDLAYLVYLSF